jgi:hypothetical protein
LQPIPKLSIAAEDAIERDKAGAREQFVLKLEGYWRLIGSDDARREQARPVDLVPFLSGFVATLADAYAREYAPLYLSRKNYRDFLKYQLLDLLLDELLPTRVLAKMAEESFNEVSPGWESPDGVWECGIQESWLKFYGSLSDQETQLDLDIHRFQMLFRRPVLSASFHKAIQKSFNRDVPTLRSLWTRSEQQSRPVDHDTNARSARRRAVIDPILKARGLSTYRWERDAKVASKVGARYLKGETSLRRDTRKKLAEAVGLQESELPQ